MKIRQGFVSNSSSSSFICGMWSPSSCPKYTIEETITILQKILDFYNDLEEKHLSFDDVFETPRLATTEDIEFLKDWDVEKERVEGRILINSKEDNTIPYMLFKVISEKFHAERIHLG